MVGGGASAAEQAQDEMSQQRSWWVSLFWCQELEGYGLGCWEALGLGRLGKSGDAASSPLLGL